MLLHGQYAAGLADMPMTGRKYAHSRARKRAHTRLRRSRRRNKLAVVSTIGLLSFRRRRAQSVSAEDAGHMQLSYTRRKAKMNGD